MAEFEERFATEVACWEYLVALRWPDGFVCPHCGKTVCIFGSGGGTRMAEQMDVPFLGEIPLDAKMVELGDKGRLDALMEADELDVNKAYRQILKKIIEA